MPFLQGKSQQEKVIFLAEKKFRSRSELILFTEHQVIHNVNVFW